ncbi:carboxypeptidase-like regulatory domain-containing protein [Pelobium manganitolerans]|uniref:carboxypeptidase-like regulatory domain-containing protein n=1 Tax=Pelobium manganitolerans TaxID=1842495 RepID=UPI003FA36C2C
MTCKKTFLSILISLSTQMLFAQSTMLKGLVFERGSNKRLENVFIQNKTHHTKTDEWGNFQIEASIGDTLYFSKIGFADFQQVISAKQNLLIYLEASIALDEVKVKGQTKLQEQREVLDEYRAKGVFYNGDPPLLVYIFSPLTALRELLSTDANNAKRFSNYAARENAETMVDRHFNKTVIKQSIPIKDEDLAEFMYYHRPKAEDVKYWTRYDDMAYIKQKYKEFLKRKKL